MRHALTICLLACAASSAVAADADACLPPYVEPGARVHPSGEVAQSANVMIESKGRAYEDFTYDLTGPDGEVVRLSEASRTWLSDPEFPEASRKTYAPDAPLSPGAYTLTLSGEQSDEEALEGVPRSVTFTVTSDLPPEGAAPSPTLSWRAVAHEGAEDDGVFDQGAVNPCGLSSEDVTLELDFDVSVPGATTPGHVTLSWDDGREERHSIIRDVPSLELNERRASSQPFVECVTATFTDIYGRVSEPTRSCVPDHCVAKHRNDRDPVDWDDVTLPCEDWSPGFAERNAPGCACAQTPGAPAGSPAALALLALGMLATRRRLT